MRVIDIAWIGLHVALVDAMLVKYDFGKLRSHSWWILMALSSVIIIGDLIVLWVIEYTKGRWTRQIPSSWMEIISVIMGMVTCGAFSVLVESPSYIGRCCAIMVMGTMALPLLMLARSIEARRGRNPHTKKD